MKKHDQPAPVKKVFLFSLLAILFATKTKAQEIEPGQLCPDIELSGLLNAPGQNIKLSDYKNKLVIIAFWSPGCHASVRSFFLMDSLQKKFAGRVQFIAANSQDKDSTLRFFKKIKLGHPPAIPFITGSQQLDAMFPHKAYPWHVWIDGTGRVQYITALHNLTGKNIQGFLDGEKLPIYNLKYLRDFEMGKPLIAEGNGRWAKEIPSYSYIAHCLPNADVMNYDLLKNEEDKSYRLSANCSSILELLVKAFSEGSKYNFKQPNTVLLFARDSSKYVWPQNAEGLDQWKLRNAYSYDMKIPAERVDAAYKKMQNDLVNFFNLEVTIKKQKMPCLLLVRTSKKDKLKTKGGVASTNVGRATRDTVRYFSNQPFSLLVATLKNQCNFFYKLRPFEDASGYRGNIDMRINKEALDQIKLPELRKELRQYDLDLIEQERPMDVLVIKEK